MRRYSIRAIAGTILMGVCLAVAACSSSPSDAGGKGGGVSQPVSHGTVTVREGNKVVCVMTVVNGKGTCKVPAAKFGIGFHTVVGEYTGAGYRNARSAPQAVNVQPKGTSTP